MSEEALANTGNAGLVDVAGLQKHDQSELEKISGSSKYLPYLQFMSANSGKCKSGEFPINHFALIQNQVHVDLGEEVDCVPLVWRPKAVDMSGEENIIIFDRKSDEDGNSTGEFGRIEQAANDNAGETGWMYGQEILLWIPEKETFATFFCGSKTLRREAPSILAYQGNPMTLRGAKIETKKWTYYSPQAVKCSAQLQPPNVDDLNVAVDAFNNEKDVIPEVVEADTDAVDRD